MSLLSRICFVVLFTAVSVVPSVPALAQSGDAKNSDKTPSGQSAEAAKEAQRRTDEFVEAARLVNGPAGNAECVWLGRRVVGLLWRDDMDTAFRHLDLYDRFGCPGPHIQASFRCVVRQGNIDAKVPRSLNERVHACWLNPAIPPATVGGAAPAAAPPAAAAAAAPAQAGAAKAPGTAGR